MSLWKITKETPSFFSRLKTGLTKTRQSLVGGIANALMGKKTLDAAVLENLETQLLTADMGAIVTHRIIQQLTERISRKEIHDPNNVFTTLKSVLFDILKPVEQPLTLSHHPQVILMVGVNGSGKTTTIGKLAHHFQQNGQTVMLAAGDTFRAAAVEQLQIWGERNKIPVIAQKNGADSAAVIFDALQAARARNIDVLIADTAGRLHTQDNLMEELKKIKRVMSKLDSTAPHETVLVLDAGIGQNAIHQAKQFHSAIKLDSLIMTKLDGTAKGGMIFNISEQLKLPIRFIGIGEKMDDLRPFCAKDFVDALFEIKQNGNDIL